MPLPNRPARKAAKAETVAGKPATVKSSPTVRTEGTIRNLYALQPMLQVKVIRIAGKAWKHPENFGRFAVEMFSASLRKKKCWARRVTAGQPAECRRSRAP